MCLAYRFRISLLTFSSQPKHPAAAEQYFNGGSQCRTDLDLGLRDSCPFSHAVVALGACHARPVPRTLAQGLMSQNAFNIRVFMIARGMSKGYT